MLCICRALPLLPRTASSPSPGMQGVHAAGQDCLLLSLRLALLSALHVHHLRYSFLVCVCMKRALQPQKPCCNICCLRHRCMLQSCYCNSSVLGGALCICVVLMCDAVAVGFLTDQHLPSVHHHQVNCTLNPAHSTCYSHIIASTLVFLTKHTQVAAVCMWLCVLFPHSPKFQTNSQDADWEQQGWTLQHDRLSGTLLQVWSLCTRQSW